MLTLSPEVGKHRMKRRDVLVQKHGLNERQGKAIEYLLGHEKLAIQDFEGLCPDVNRRSLQRDLKGMLDKELIKEIGAGLTDPTRHYALFEL
jgi:tryptophan 2,3-dioxygenase